MEPVVLKLYVMGGSDESDLALRRLRKACESRFGPNYRLEIVDIRENPEEAEAEKILATPTLVKTSPLPLRRVVGELADFENFFPELERFP